MRKRTVNYLADTIFWYLLYFLPIIGYICFMIAEPSNGTTIISLSTYMQNMGINIAENNIVLTTLENIFGNNGTLPIFTDNTFFIYFTYFIDVYIIHLLVDFILFIPRLCHKYMEKFTQGD